MRSRLSTPLQRNAKRLVLTALIVAMSGVASAIAPLHAAEIETPARQAFLLDAETGTVLLEKNADAPMIPASMTKLMTVLLVFDRLKSGSLSLDDTFTVSERAWKMGGSKMFVLVGNQVRIEDLLRGIIVQSGNDACVVVAEGMAGTEEAFGDMMTDRAREIGLMNTVFKNSTGWPDEGHISTARDIALLSQYIVNNYPDYYDYFAETVFTWNDIRQCNRNPVLEGNTCLPIEQRQPINGVDGLKTGHTQASGYGLAASAERKDRRLVLVVNGLDSERSRARESARLLEWGFREFGTYRLFAAGETIDTADVWLGEARRVPLLAAEGRTLTLPRDARKGLEVRIAYREPVPAPIRPGDPLGMIRISAPGMEAQEVPLVAGAAVERLGFVGRIEAAVNYLLWGGSSG